MGKINWNKVLVGGIAAGIVSVVFMFVVISPIMMPSWEAGMKSGMWKQPAPMNFILDNVTLLVVGILATFTYAAIRPRFGASVSTAILAGVLVALFKDITPAIGRLIWSNEPGESIQMWMGLSAVGTIVSTFVGAWIYKE